MAPLAHKDFDALPCRYWENSSQELRKFDASRIEFFFSMGLQMRNLGNEFQDNFGIADKRVKKKCRTSSVVKLRECSVVILGTACHICGKHFKCKTDLDAHVALRHFSFAKGTNNCVAKIQHVTVGTSAPRNIEELESISDTRRRSAEKIRRRKSPKLRLTLKIGPEVVTRVAIKRKHLAARKILPSAQTEFHKVSGAATKNDGNKSSVFLLSDDHPECRTSNVSSAVDKENLHFDGNVTAMKRLKHVGSNVDSNLRTESEITQNVRPSCVDRVPEIRGSSINLEKHNRPSPQNIIPQRVPILSKAAGRIPSTRSTEVCAAIDNNPNDEVQEVLRITRGGQENLTTDIIPQRVPILSKTTSRIPSTRSTEVCAAIDNNHNDEVQEVLRITRGRHENLITEINHESPNRSEREILVLDAIKDMLRIEHLLGKDKRGVACLNYTTNVVRIPNVKVLSAETQKFDVNQLGPHASDMPKENVITGNRYLNATLEDLSRYGINFYNDSSMINCNNKIGEVSKPKHNFCPPRCSGTEESNHSKQTIVIDLVGDNDD